MPISRAAADGTSAARLVRLLLLAAAALICAEGALAQQNVVVSDSYTVEQGDDLEGNVTANDVIVTPGFQVAVLDGVAAGNSLEMNNDGSFEYEPDDDFVGTDDFTYEIRMGGSPTSGIATVTITVTAEEEEPTAVNDTYSTAEDTQLTVPAPGVLANDTDANGDAFTAALENDVDNGTLALSANGSFIYTPDANFTGTDSFTYRATDDDGESNAATVTITVSGANDPPVANDDSYSVSWNTTLNVNAANGVLDNDTDADTASLATVLLTNPASGTLQLNANGSFTYTPNSGFSGTDSFTYQASDGVGGSAPATVTITVNQVNVAPAAAADAYTTPEDTQLTVAAPGVLQNDTDANGNTLSAELANDVDNGTLALAANGGFVYTPNANFSGQDSFTYRATDGTLDSTAVTVTITVSAGNDAPTAANDSYNAGANTPLTVNAANGVLANDTDLEGDALTAAVVTNPASGTLLLNADGSFTYTPSTGFSGNDTFTYQASDGTAPSNAATVTISVAAPNAPPTATNDSYTASEGTRLSVNAANGVLANDTDPEGGNLTAVLVDNVASGTLDLNSNGSFTYDPPDAFAGAVTFTYQADDGPGISNTATVTITVNAVDDPPTAAPDSYTTQEDTPLTVSAATGVLANDTDPDSPASALSAVVARTVNNGSLTLNANGSFTYTPAANFAGTATFTYQARDATSSSDAATVTITVTAVNDPPFFTNAPPTSVNEGVTYSYALGVADPDGDTVTIAATTLPTWLTFRGPATITGTPTQDNVGVHDVTMTATDGIAAPIVRSFQITVAAVDNAPTVSSIAPQIATEGAPFSLDLNQFVTDPDTPAASLVYAATGGLPPGLTLAANGLLSGTPTAATSIGDFTVRFTVADTVSRVPGQLPLSVLRAGRVDLAVALAAAPNPVAVNAQTTWTLTITNQAPLVEVPSVTAEAVFTGDVPFRFDAPANPGCTITPSGNENRMACTVGPLAGGASLALTVTGTGSLAGDVFATATVAVNGPVPIDETPANNSVSASLNIAQRVSAAPAQEIPGLGAQAGAAGDLDADGFDDLALVTNGGGGTIVLLNVPDPANANKRALSTSPLMLGGEALGTDVAMADLDGDGDLDVVTAAAAGAPNRIFLAAAGAFPSTALGDPAADTRAVAVGDVNGDSFLDLVFANAGASTVFVNSGSPAAPFSTGTPLGNHDARDAVLADLSGDALPELVLAIGNGDAAIYRNTAGVFALERTLATGPTISVAAADFNGDGRLDLVFGRSAAVAPATSPTNPVWLNTSGAATELFLADELGAAATSHVLPADLDLDGDSDILAMNGDGQQLYTNAGSGTFALHPQAMGARAARMATAGRFGADERLDVAVIANGGVSVFYNDGAGNLGAGDTSGPTIQLLGQPTVSVIVGEAYADAGATASDALDGDVTSRITVTNPVNTAVIGDYAVQYAATDLSGNSAAIATRTVQVRAREESGGGGGGALRPELLFLLLLALAAFTGRARAPRAD